MKNIFQILLLIIINQICLAQELSPEGFGFEAYTMKTEDLGEVNYYLTIDSSAVEKPLLVYLDGSGGQPLFQKTEHGIASSVVIDFQNLQKDYRILLISKPGLPFIDTVESSPSGFPIYEEPDEYTRRLSLEWRVNSANQIINDLLANNKANQSSVIVLGFSEGAQVGPSLAKINKNVSHLLLFGGNGLNQFFDPIISARMKASTGQISEVEAQKEIDSLFYDYKSIYNEPENVEKEWWGHTYKRWSSFTQTDPYKCLLELEIPIYMANGSLDENSILSADYIQLEFIKNRKENLTYKTYPNHDHQFNEIFFENGQFVDAKSNIDLVMSEAFQWLKNQ